MIKLFILAMRLALFIGNYLKERGQLEDALKQVEGVLGKVASEMAGKAIAARDNVSLDPDSMLDDPRNIDRFPVEKGPEKRD